MFGIQTEPTSDVGGGLNIGWQDTNDWMDYSVNVSAAGTYTVNFRVATMFNGPQFQLRNAAGTVLATVNVPNTGSFQSWQTVSAQVSLPAGQQILRIHTSNAAGGWNLNWWEIIGGTSTPPPSSSQKIEAEHYATMQGIQTEPTSDAGGGLNVGWQDSGDWMDYSVNVSSAGTYTMNFRVATMFNGPQFQVRNSAGTVMATVNVPNTGSFQTWQTISTQVSLPAGQQTIRIFTSNAAGGWNINWFEIVGGTSTSSLRTTITSNLADANEAAADRPSAVYPNPVQDRFIFTVNNELTGNFRVEIINMAGSVSKAFQLQKTLQGAVPFYLSMNGLQKGAYIIRATMGTWSFSTKVVKE
jgi:endoglucanase